ncbi:hypothetical protein M0804_014468 [Polistes exclamans]|nr:hypothetical protein M0804_014468 [Polistes exclamans]
MRSDKGNNTVIMKKEEYLNEMHKMLQNKNIYQLLNKDPTSRFEKLANNLIMKLRKESIIMEEIEKNMKSYNSVAPKIYGLRKTHKQGLALRPIDDYNRHPILYELSSKYGVAGSDQMPLPGVLNLQEDRTVEHKRISTKFGISVIYLKDVLPVKYFVELAS